MATQANEAKRKVSAAKATASKRQDEGKTREVLRMPFGTATFVLASSIAMFYFALSNGAAYPPLPAIMAGSLGADSLPFGAVTYLFDHAGLGHLLENLAGLLIFCLVVEAALSYKDALAIFFLSGVAGGIAFLVVTPQARIIGASAGIVGLAVAGTLSDPKRGVLALALVALMVNWAAPAVAGWAAAESYKSLEQQKEMAQQKARELLSQQKPVEAQEQLRVAQEKQRLIEQQERTKKSEAESGAADAAHVVGALAGALYVVAFRQDVMVAWMKKAKHAIAKTIWGKTTG
ncbi:MAG: rhomboid family intramembrane serine protease [Candidatus Micrarchaeia archaeon]|jgi:membrane associated rhomboid family serine protease